MKRLPRGCCDKSQKLCPGLSGSQAQGPSFLAPVVPDNVPMQRRRTTFPITCPLFLSLSPLSSDLSITIALRNKHQEPLRSDELAETQTGGGTCPLCPWQNKGYTQALGFKVWAVSFSACCYLWLLFCWLHLVGLAPERALQRQPELSGHLTDILHHFGLSSLFLPAVLPILWMLD